MSRLLVAALAVGLSACGKSQDTEPASGGLNVVGVEPAPRGVAARGDSVLAVRFDRPLRRESVSTRSFWAYGKSSGPVRGALEFADGDRTVRLVPERPFLAGESVMVVVSSQVQASDGTSLERGHAFTFWVRAQPAAAAFAETGRLHTRSDPSVQARAYGGVATDLDGDGFADLAIVNEDAADLSVYMNGRNGTFRTVPERPGLGRRPSPSEAADFDRDGRTDLAVVNIGDASVSVLLGRGDGTFGAAQVVRVGSTPRGLAVLDVDGDGDLDLATANAGSSDVTLLRNDGSGRFEAALSLDAGVDQEWALAAADMDEDGRLDLVVGGQAGRSMAVLRSVGQFGLERVSTQAVGGGPWMIVTGDLDGDGHEDVASANGRSNNASVLRGDGRGNLAAADVHEIRPFGLASDLGDVDGDGDLDWMTSSFDGEWRLLENRGGRFQPRAAFEASEAASCALVADLDRDGRLDLALIDEEADEVLLMTGT